jgi:hypothetical protein
MRILREAALPRVKAYFGMTLLPENTGAVEAAIEAARDAVPGLTERDFHFNIGMQSGHYYRNLDADTTPPRRALKVLERHRRRGFDVVSMLERAYQKRVGEYLDTGRSPVPCAAVRASVFVDAQGTVYPCSIYDRPIGRLPERGYDLGAVLSEPEARAAREEVEAEACPGCWTPCEAYQSLFAKLTGSAGRRAGSSPTRKSTAGSAAAGRP